MNITKENIDALNAIVKVKVGPTDYQEKVEKTLKEYQKKVSMPGFRPGKVPAGMIKKMYGKSVLADELNKLLNDSLYNYINENKLEVLGNPLPNETSGNVDFDNETEFEFAYDLALAPEFTVDLSSGDKFYRPVVKIDDEQINNYINDISRRYGQIEKVEVSEDGDLFYGDFVELDANGEIVAGGIYKTSTFFPENSEANKGRFAGLKENDKIDITNKDIEKDAYHLASKLGISQEEAAVDRKFRFTVKQISRLKPAAVDQSLFDKLYGEGVVTSEEQFRTKVREQLGEMYKGDSENRLKKDIVEHLITKVHFSLPDEFLKRWLVTVSKNPVTPEEVEKNYDGYQRELKWQLIENKIIKDNQITVTSDEAKEYVKALIIENYARYGRPAEMAEIEATTEKVLGNEEEAKRVYENLYNEKVMDLLKSKFSVEDREMAVEEFYKK